MSTSQDRASDTNVPTEVLDELHRRIVAIHYGLAEHGPTDPKMVLPWALAELREVTAYIRAAKKAQSASTP
jgi:hypothetical protein